VKSKLLGDETDKLWIVGDLLFS